MSAHHQTHYSAFAPGNYAAEQQPDGRWIIRGVPVFAEHKRGGEVIDEAWMLAAIERDESRRAEGYVAPLHIEHSSAEDVPQRAGHFALTRVAPGRYEGQTRNILYADLTDIPDEVFEEIKAGKLPYRSAEIHDFDSPEINSIALMQSKVPYFRFALLTVKGADEYATDAKPVMFYSGEREGRKVARAVYACGRDEYTTEAQAMNYEEMDEKALLLALCEKLDAMASSKGAEMEADAEEDVKIDVTEEASEGDDAEAMSDDEVEAMLSDKEESMPPESNSDSTPAEIDEAKKSGEYSALAARLSRTEAELSAMKRRDDQREWALKAQKELGDLGVSNREIAEYSAKPAAVRDTWLDTTRKHLSMDNMPPRSVESYTTGYTAGAMVGNVSPEVAEYSARGHVAVKAASDLEAEYEAHKSRGGLSASKADYIRNGIEEMGL